MWRPHAKDECTEQPKEVPICINCKKEDHVASYKGCEMYPKPKERRIQYQTSRKVDSTISFADMAKSRTNQNKPTENPELTAPKINPLPTPNSVSEIHDLFFVLQKFKRLYKDTNIALLANTLKSQTNDIDKTHTLLKWLSATHPLTNN
ncbi:hypothetical protein AVEN_48880-1 [Araneus ventricosus]|uniref:Pre-C2HC domain-containing protein n=1 Tax=Araneus ventricosus TaxID=182803 RepID=A0A4Y2AGF8_ARAVE|nr:hypothetical protein AVEN_48880-1 [Araneus ventricosus]